MKTLLFCSLMALSLSSFFSPAVLVRPADVPKDVADTFPVPPQNNRMVFYVQRTHNTNTIVYDLNYNADSTLNSEEPIHAYWLRFADGGGTKELSYVQKNYAYGLNTTCIDKEKQTYKVNFVSYKKRDIYLMRAKNSKIYHACVMIDNKMAYLTRVFAKIDGGTFWLPHITYVELRGHDITTGKPVSEKITP